MTEWVPFSHRYGIVDVVELGRWCDFGGQDYTTERWRARHDWSRVLHSSKPDGGAFTPPLLRCICPSSPGHPRCADRASQEDRLCDPCREHCVAVDNSARYHRLIDVYGGES